MTAGIRVEMPVRLNRNLFSLKYNLNLNLYNNEKTSVIYSFT